MVDTTKFEDAFIELAEQDAGFTLEIITRLFVELTIKYTEMHNRSSDCDIVVEVEDSNRKITIHKEHV